MNLILFKNTQQVLKFHAYLKNNHHEGELFKIVPLPRSISSDCGMALLQSSDGGQGTDSILKAIEYFSSNESMKGIRLYDQDFRF